ncbi:TOX high mobility group box family member 4 [Rhea pennata]|uniref:TOX high mobility group box family member 4 n=1 Tax=Rhea pennata TaxID=8795 RepID=UPI002E275AC7
MEFPGGNDNYLAITGTAHPFLTGAETFHTPSLGDEEFEIPPIALDADPSLAVSDVVGHFDDLGDPGSAADAGFSAQYGVQALDMPVGMSHSLMEQGGGLLSGGLSMELDHSMGAQYSANPPVTIDVPMAAMSPGGLLGHGQLTTIDQSELSSQLGLSLGGGSNGSGSTGAAAGAAVLPPAPARSPQERLSPAPSPAGSLQEDEAEEFRRQAPAQKTPTPPPPPTTATATLVLDPGRKQKPPKKQKKKKDPNEPQKPVSAYALFFRDTQAAIKGQNPNATFGEVSKIVASMWDSLGEEQKQVYKRKTEAAKKEYLKALAAYRATIQTSVETVELDPGPTSPAAPPAASPAPEASPAAPAPAPPPSITKIIIPKQMLPSSLAVSSQGGVVTVIPATVVTSRGGLQLGAAAGATQIVTRSVLQAAAAAAAAQQQQQQQLPRLQPPPLQQMPPPQPPAQQVAVLQPPPPLQAMQQPPAQQKARLHLQQPQPPPLQIKILPPPALQIQPLALAAEEEEVASPERTTAASAAELQGSPEPVEMIAADVVPEVESPTQMAVELVAESPAAESPRPRCVRSGCENPPVASSDWDNEYCSSECVVKHCRDVFLAWLASRNSSNSVVFVK